MKWIGRRLANGIKSKSAFTLIELLVVIAIIGILAALVTSGVQGAKSRAHQVTCVNNLRQLTLINNMYSDDVGKHMGYEHPAYPFGTWMGTLRSQGNFDKLIACPAAQLRDIPPRGADLQGTADSAWVRWTIDSGKTMFAGGFGYNGWLYEPGRWNGGEDKYRSFFFNRAHSIPLPSTTPMFCDETWVDLWPLENDLAAESLYSGRSYWDWNNEMGRATIPRHAYRPSRAPRSFDPRSAAPLPGAIDVSFVDGHVDLVKLEKLWSLTWHVDWKAGGRPH